jgi:hypothetical protein
MRLLLNLDTNQVKRKRGTRGEAMKTGRPTHSRSRKSKSKQGAQRAGKNYEALQDAITNDDETIPLEPTHSLLLSSLRYWEVERDLIEERIAARVR